MKLNLNMPATAGAIAAVAALSSCQPTDREDPTVCTGLGAEFSVTAAEIDVLAGDTITLNVPLTARGIWHVNVSLVDSAGNAEEFLTDLHIENNHLPEFKLTSIDGLDPATLDDEVEWNINSLVLIEGVVSDSDGVAMASLMLVEEDSDSVFWSTTLAPAGATTFAFSDTLTAPSVEGDFHMELTATDGTGVDMETEFHVEVED